MRFKRYILFSLLFFMLVVAYTHLNINSSYALDFFGIQAEYPVAFWVIVPALALFIASVAHFGFYSFLTSLKRSRLEKDLNKIKTVTKYALLNAPHNESIKDERLGLLTDLISNARLRRNENFYFRDEELNEIIAMTERIDAGEYVDLSRFKLPSDNEISMKNQANRLDFEPAYAEKILNNCDEATPLCLKAFEVYAKTAEKRKIDRITLTKTKPVVFAMLGRYRAEKNPLEFSKDEIVSLCKGAAFSSEEYVKVARILLKNMEPDELLEICYHLQLEIEEAASAYLYVNLELEKNNVAREYLEQFDEEELDRFRYYMILKENGAKVTLSDFIG